MFFSASLNTRPDTIIFFSLFSIHPPPELLPVLGQLERYMTPTLDVALLCSSRVGSDLGRKSDWLRSFVNWVSSFPVELNASPRREKAVLCEYMPRVEFDPPRAESGYCVFTLLSLNPLSHHNWIFFL